MRTRKKIASRLIGCAVLGVGLSVIQTQTLNAGTFSSDFNSGVPPTGMNLYGNATSYDHSSGGKTGGALKLTTTDGSQQSSAIIDDFDNGAVIGGFDATFQLFIGGGTGADGMSFVFGDFADNSWGEEGPGGGGAIHGLTVSFDEYNNGGTPPEAPAIDVKWNGVTVFHRLVGATSATSPASPIGSATTIRTQTTSGGAPVYVPVKIHADTDGTVDVVFNNVVIVTNLPVFRPLDPNIEPPTYGSAYRFGFGARTGGSADNHWIDDLTITTVPVDSKSGQPSIVSMGPQPVGLNASAAESVRVVFTNNATGIDTNSVKLLYNNNAVTPTITVADGLTTINYRGGANNFLPSGKTTVTLGYNTTATPAISNVFSYNFVVDPATTSPTNWAVANVDTSKPGFTIRKVHQMERPRMPSGDANQIILAERQLAEGYINPDTGLPYPNTADLTAAAADGSFIEPGVLNYNYTTPEIGNFQSTSTPSRPDATFPGIPGTSATPTDNFVMEFDTILQLQKGGNRFGINSDDGFRVSFGPGWDAAGTIVGSYNGGRGSADTLFDVVIPADGYYPVRITYWQGGGGANMEFFWVDPDTGAKVLVNDPDNLKAPRAYRDSPVSRPFISRVLPVQNYIGAFPNDDVIVDITDGNIPLTGATFTINNATQNVTSAKSGKTTTLKRVGSVDNLLPSGLNTVRVIYSFTENGNAVTLTNTYSYTVAPYYNVLPAGNRVTSVNTGDTGFTMFVDQMDKSSDANQGNGARINAGGDSNRMPWPEVELAGGEINPTNGLRYPNLAQAGANNDHIFTFDVINWQYNNNAAAVAQSGWFQTTQPPAPLPGQNSDIGVPGLPGTGTSYGGLENAVFEIKTYLQLKKGIYVMGFNSDDGFVAISAPNPSDTLGTLVGFFSGGRGNSAQIVGTTLPAGQTAPIPGNFLSAGSTLFSVIVPEDGIYPFRILYWQGGTGINAEFFAIRKENGDSFLIGDTTSDAANPVAIPAYRTYTGPARPYVKFSVAPTFWDNGVQQVGPGPITMVGKTRANVGANDIYNYPNTNTARPWPNVAIGGVIGNGTSDANLGLLLDGAPVPAILTTNGTDVTVAYQPNPPLPSASTHTAGLIYAGTTNYWSFTVQIWTNLNASDALPLSQADPNSRGFRVKMAQTTNSPAPAGTVARAEAQLAGAMGQNLAIPGPGPDGTYIYTNIINWTNNNPAGIPQGNFQANTYGAATGWPFPFYTDEPIPGIPGTGRTTADYASAEVFAYLAFPTNGMYRLGVNSDDAFGMKVGTPGVTNGTVIANWDLGKGASDIPVSFFVPQAGLYPIRLIWFNGTGGAALEYFSYDINGNKIPINDWNNPASIKAYYAVTSVVQPHIKTVNVVNGNVTITWENGGTLESTSNLLTGPWTSTGNSTGTFTEPASGGMKFYRVKQ